MLETLLQLSCFGVTSYSIWIRIFPQGWRETDLKWNYILMPRLLIVKWTSWLFCEVPVSGEAAETDNSIPPPAKGAARCDEVTFKEVKPMTFQFDGAKTCAWGWLATKNCGVNGWLYLHWRFHTWCQTLIVNWEQGLSTPSGPDPLWVRLVVDWEHKVLEVDFTFSLRNSALQYY